MTDMARRMLRDRIMDRAREGGEYYDREDGRRMRDRAMDRASGDHRDYRYDREPERYHERDYDDGRRRGASGRYVRDRRDYADRMRHERGHYGEEDERDYRDYRDSHGGREPRLKLPREDMRRWGEMLINADGSEGAHFEARMLKERIQHMDHDMEGYTEEDLCMAANMLYSDYCEVLKPYISREPEKEADFYLKMAKAFLDDEDAPDGSAKLAMYYFCIADVEE